MWVRRKQDPAKAAVRADRRKRNVAIVALAAGVAGLASQQFFLGALFTFPAGLYLRWRAIERRHARAVESAIRDVDVVIRGRR
jgi:hypothetical protein